VVLRTRGLSSTEIDITGRIVAVRENGAVVLSSPSQPPLTNRPPDAITYDVKATYRLPGSEYDSDVALSNITPAGRVTTTATIDSARVRDRCDISICAGEVRVWVRESVYFADCETGGAA
jgi:hypothetical protein